MQISFMQVGLKTNEVRAMPARLTSQKQGGTSPPNSPGNLTPPKTKINTINSSQIHTYEDLLLRAAAHSFW